MGSAISSIFGGGYSAPEVPQSDPVPVREEAKEPEAAAARDEERRKLRARSGGIAGTLLTSPLGVSGQKSGGGNLLGRLGN